MALLIGIIGAGSIAAKFCEATKLVNGVEVISVASKSYHRASKFAADNNIRFAYGDYREMLDNQNIDLVYIATTGNFHYENILLCLSYHKHVLCEKTMVMTVKEAEIVFKTAQKCGCFVMEAMWSCFVPSVQKAREWIHEGLIGEVQTACYMGGINAPPEHRIYNKELGGGALYDLAVYPIEILAFVINQPLISVQSHIRFGPTGVDEMNSMILQFASCNATLQCTTHSRIPSPAAFYGSKGYIKLENAHKASECERYDEQFALVEKFEYPIVNGFEFEIAHVRDCILDGKQQSDIMPWSATLQCIYVIEKCLKKLRLIKIPYS